MEAFAADGFWVFAPDHNDARCGSAHRSGSFSLKLFRTPEIWDPSTFADRRNDIVKLIQTIKLN